MVNWRYLPASNEVIWYSERSNWGHLYLYDLATGKLKNQITTGDFVVTELLRVDEKARTLYFLATGGRRARSLFQSPVSRGLRWQGTDTLLTPEDANHEVTFSPSGRYFVDNYSKPDAPPVSVLARRRGQAAGDARKGGHLQVGGGGMEAAGADHREGARRRDGSLRADVQAHQSRSAKKYPIVNHIYPGPQGAAWAAGRSRRRAAMRRRWPSWDSSW
jgi:dipeptidyl aminopeptidase/acylaminoacyl peptidase